MESAGLGDGRHAQIEGNDRNELAGRSRWLMVLRSCGWTSGLQHPKGSQGLVRSGAVRRENSRS
jgi:hypothetical protein